MTKDWKKEQDLRGQSASKQQRQASDPRCSVWVEASAGTGKTKVLSDRVLRLLLRGVPPAKILCLTYTKAAAVEMNDRIAKRLSEWAVISDEELNKQLTKLEETLPLQQEKYQQLVSRARQLFAVLLDTPGGMKIQTLHSFCQEVLKRFPLEAKISPYFEVMDDRSKREILDRLRVQMLDEAEASDNYSLAQAVGYLAAHLGETSFPKMMNSITENAGKMQHLFENYDSLDALFDELARRLGVMPAETEDSLKQQWLRQLDATCLQAMVRAWLSGSKKDIEKAELLSPLLERPFEINDYEVISDLFLKENGEPYAQYATKKALEIYPEFNAQAVRIAESLQNLDKHFAALRVFVSTKAVLCVAQELIHRYQSYKFEYAKMDYDDLILLTRRLLEDKSVADWVLFKLDGGIDHLLIDEAQDTSPNQWAIVRALTQEFFDEGRGARTVFVVGDRKQSIYSFQGADPREFEKMRHYFQTQSTHWNEVNLDISFRSSPAIMDVVNTVFANPVAKKGVLPDDQNMLHVPFRCGEAGKVEIWPLIETEENDDLEAWRPPIEKVHEDSSSSRLARLIAATIKQQVGHDKLASQNRVLQFRDFLILVQRRNRFVNELVRELKKAGVAIAGVDKIKLSEQVAVQDLIALGKFLLLPTDDLTLAEVLKSPLFGLTDDDLFKLCYRRGQASVWTRLCDNQDYQEVCQILRSLLNKADYIRPFELYSYVLGPLGGRELFRKRMGTEVDDGLDEFINLTLMFEQEHIPTLQAFIHWMGQDEVEIKREQEQSDVDAVRIMTVHGSKGLQAPIVILPDTVRMISLKKEMDMLWDDFCYYPLSAADYDPHCVQLKTQNYQDEIDEYHRLLYVALTRAEDRLYICGYAQRNKPREGCWYDICCQQLKTIASEQNNKLVYQTAQQFIPVEKSTPIVSKEDFISPAWVAQKAVTESPLAKPYTPSKPDDTDDDETFLSPLSHEGENKYKRGLVIHRLLQYIPDVAKEQRLPAIHEFLRQNAADFSEAQRQRMAEEVFRLVTSSDFAPLFGPHSKAEVPIMGEVNGKIISAQLDRLALLDNEVWIVDFKTNRPAAKTPEDVQAVYRTQLADYKSLVQRIYPEKTVKTFLLWTDTTQIMQIV